MAGRRASHGCETGRCLGKIIGRGGFIRVTILGVDLCSYSADPAGVSIDNTTAYRNTSLQSQLLTGMVRQVTDKLSRAEIFTILVYQLAEEFNPDAKKRGGKTSLQFRSHRPCA